MKLIKKILLFFPLLINFILAKITLAQDPLSRLQQTAQTANLPETAASPQRIIFNVVMYALGFVGIFFTVSLLYGGFKWMTSGGASDKIDEAKARLKNSLIGIVIILAAFLITVYVEDILRRTTTDGYYAIPGGGGNPSGDCSNDADCVRQFGEGWSCNNRGSCLHSGEQAPVCASNWECHNVYGLGDDYECRGNRCRLK